MPFPDFPRLQTGVLLCIDDDEEVLECEKSFLESFGYTVLTVEKIDVKGSMRLLDRLLL